VKKNFMPQSKGKSKDLRKEKARFCGLAGF
jgi:hypothetical protein